MTNNQVQKFYYYGILKSNNRHGFSENASDFKGTFKTLTETEMLPFVNRDLNKHIEWDDSDNPILVPYNTQYWGEYEGGRLVRFAGYRFSETCVKLDEKPDWGE